MDTVSAGWGVDGLHAYVRLLPFLLACAILAISNEDSWYMLVLSKGFKR